MIFLIIALAIALFYMAIQFQYIFYWKLIKPVIVPFDFDPSSGVSVIVVARNEADTVLSCLQGILSQSYPGHLVEILVIDDHSTDETINKVLTLRDESIQLLRLQHYPEYIFTPAYKKSAITLGVEKARHEMILVTDADCIHSKDWIRSVVYAFEQSNSRFQTAPVLLLPGRSLLEQMQELEMLVYALVTGAGIQSRWHDMANGANMAFTKKAFQSVKGFEGNYQYASGDDMFLVEKMRTAFPDHIHFAKSTAAAVLTKGKTSWSDLLKQRLRWASKNKGLANLHISMIWTFIGIFHFSMLLFLILAVFHLITWMPFLVLISFKWVADYFVIQQAAAFFNRMSVLRNFILLQFLFTWYIIRLTVYMLFDKQVDWKR